MLNRFLRRRGKRQKRQEANLLIGRRIANLPHKIQKAARCEFGVDKIGLNVIPFAFLAQQDYLPVAGNLLLSVLAAAIPIVVLLYFLGIKRTSAEVAALFGLGAALMVSLFCYHLPVAIAVSAVGYGAAFGFFPICWIIIWALFLYRITVETGKFQIVKDSIGSLTTDRRLQALLIAFSFGAFVEGAAGFGTPVAVAAAMLTGLGFSPFYAAAICLLANTAPVAFGSIAIPVMTLAGITGLPLDRLSAE